MVRKLSAVSEVKDSEELKESEDTEGETAREKSSKGGNKEGVCREGRWRKIRSVDVRRR